MRELAERVAVVTGAAGGLGSALAAELAARGCRLALVDNRGAALEALSARLKAATPTTAHAADVSRREDWARLRDEVLSAHGAAHLLVNNAGVTLVGLLDEFSDAEVDRVVGTNLYGALHGCRAFLPLMKRQGLGHVVNVSSMLGLTGMPGQSTYALTKFALRGLSESLRGELAPFGIGVTVVYPGAVRTPMIENVEGPAAERARPVLAKAARWAKAPEAAARRIVRAVRRNEARAVLGVDGHVFDWVSRLWPGLLASAAGRSMGPLLRAEGAAKRLGGG